MQTNENIESIIGNPKKAINRLAFPTILSMLLMFANNLIDSMWVGSLGPEPLAALGFISPLYLVIIGFGVGIGTGANSSSHDISVQKTLMIQIMPQCTA